MIKKLYQLAWLLLLISFIATMLPLFLSFEDWYIRMFDFPRLQILSAALIAVIIFSYFYLFYSKRSIFALILCVSIILYQGYKIYPYTNFASPQTAASQRAAEQRLTVDLLIANVYMENRDYVMLVEQIQNYNADIVILLEPDQQWLEAIAPDMKDYKEQVLVPIDNTYGMALYSKLPLQDTEVKYLVEPDIPSISTKVIKDSLIFQLYSIHPRPPVPTEAPDSEERDAEIILIGKKASQHKLPVIVAGDFNDVAWSSNTMLFQRSSGLLDPRVGRGFFNTFNANNFLLRWPLDHVFHSEEFMLVDMQRLPDIHSDHFPIYIQLSYEPEHSTKQDIPEKKPDTEEKAQEAIEEGMTDTDK